MTDEDRIALEAQLEHMRTIHAELTRRHAGICVLHLEAAIAALESHLRRNGASAFDELRASMVGLTEPAAANRQANR